MSGSISAIDAGALRGAAGATVDRLHHVLKQQRAQGNGTAVGQSALSAANSKLAASGGSVSVNGAITDVNTVLRQTGAQYGSAVPQFAFPNNAATLSQDVGAATQGLANAFGNGNAVRDAKAFAGNAVSDLANQGIDVTRGLASSIVNQTITSVDTNQNQSPAAPPGSVNLIG